MTHRPSFWIALLSIALAAHALSLSAADAASAPEIRIRDEAGMGQARIDDLRAEFERSAGHIYTYLQRSPSHPINVVITRRVPIGMYVGDEILLPPDDNHGLLETWLHELTHEVTGHDSAFLLKEGIATHVVEAVLAESGQIPQGWPNYGVSADDWAHLYSERGQLEPLARLLARSGYDGSSAYADYRSWQAYLVGGSFCGWLIRTQGLDAFRQAFDHPYPIPHLDRQERAWLVWLRAKPLRHFDPAEQLPQGARYQNYALRLTAP